VIQVKAGSELPVIGHFGGLSGSHYVELTFDGASLLSKTCVPFDSTSTFHLSADIPSETIPGIHQLCATAEGTQVCTQIIVCTSCQPMLGFVGAYGITSRSINIQSPPQTDFTVVGDNFIGGSQVTISFDTENDILGTSPVSTSGHFTATLKLPSGVLYGSHVVTAAGSTMKPNPSGDKASATLDVVRFIPL
jgi:hypothetical protein